MMRAGGRDRDESVWVYDKVTSLARALTKNERERERERGQKEERKRKKTINN